MPITARPEVLAPETAGDAPSRGTGGGPDSGSGWPSGGVTAGGAGGWTAAGATPGAVHGVFSDRNLDLLSHLLDDFIRIPGTPIRFGLDGIVGFLPGVGDVLGGLASSIIILAAWKRGIPRAVVARMVLNVAIETAAGSVPVLGNLFDIGWRANRRNYALLIGQLHGPDAAPKRAGNWLFIAGVVLALLLLLLIPVFLGGLLLVFAEHLLFQHGAHRL